MRHNYKIKLNVVWFWYSHFRWNGSLLISRPSCVKGYFQLLPYGTSRSSWQTSHRKLQHRHIITLWLPFQFTHTIVLLQRTQAINLLYGSGSRKDKGFALLLSKDKTRATNSPLEHTQNLWFYLVLCAIPLTQTKDSLTLVLLFLPVVQNTQGRGTT